MFVLLIDEVNGKFDVAKEKFTTVYLKDLKIPKLSEMIERYGVAEFCTAVKPYLLEYLFEKQKLERVCYFDPDIYFYGPIDKIWNELEKSAIILTPHILGPLDEAHRPNEFTVFQAGIFNLGFLGLARGKESTHLLPWWQERLVKYAHNAPEKNEHYDQKWMDLIPGFYDKVAIDRSPGYNVAYWDFSNRKITLEHERYFANGQPLIFFHFSGYSPREPEVISKYQDRFTFGKLPELKEIFDQYGKRLFANGYQETSAWPVEIKDPTFIEISAGKQKEQPIVTMTPWLYRRVTSGLASVGLERPLTALIGRKNINRLQRTFLRPAAIAANPTRKLAAGINVLGFFEHAGGVGEVARRSVRALAEAGLPVSWTTLEGAGKSNFVTEDLPKTSEKNLAINVWHVNADILPGVMAQHKAIAESGAVNVAYWAWELPEFPTDWSNRATLLDEIWVGSTFVQQAVSQQVSAPVHVMGAPVETLPVDPAIRKRLGLPENRFLFLFTFDMASYIDRKNPLAIAQAYRRAFGENFSETMLVMKVLNAHKYPKEREYLRDALTRVGGRLLEDVLPRADLHCLMASCDAYVSLHRAEGFGVTIAEAMAYGRPVIATHYSGNADYMTEANCYPIPYRLTTLEHDIGPYRAGGTWADPDTVAAAEAMHAVVHNKEEAQRKGAKAAHDIEERYSFGAFARRMQERLAALTHEKLWQRVSES